MSTHNICFHGEIRKKCLQHYGQVFQKGRLTKRKTLDDAQRPMPTNPMPAILKDRFLRKKNCPKIKYFSLFISYNGPAESLNSGLFYCFMLNYENNF